MSRKRKQEDGESKGNRKKKRLLVLGFSPYYGVLKALGYEFKRGVPKEVAEEDVEVLLGKHKLLKEV